MPRPQKTAAVAPQSPLLGSMPRPTSYYGQQPAAPQIGPFQPPGQFQHQLQPERIEWSDFIKRPVNTDFELFNDDVDYDWEQELQRELWDAGYSRELCNKIIRIHQEKESLKRNARVNPKDLVGVVTHGSRFMRDDAVNLHPYNPYPNAYYSYPYPTPHTVSYPNPYPTYFGAPSTSNWTWPGQHLPHHHHHTHNPYYGVPAQSYPPVPGARPPPLPPQSSFNASNNKSLDVSRESSPAISGSDSGYAPLPKTEQRPKSIGNVQSAIEGLVEEMVKKSNNSRSSRSRKDRKTTKPDTFKESMSGGTYQWRPGSSSSGSYTYPQVPHY